MVILQAQALTLLRDAKALVRQVSLTVQAGEILALVGPNGAGKSSLLNLLSGEWRASSGVLEIQGKSQQAWSPSALALLRAVLPQHSPLSFPFTAREVVAFGRIPHNTGKQEDDHIVQATLSACDVLQLADQPYPQLSGGEKQRVHWARVMAQVWDVKTPLMLMDEPTSALDLSHQHSLMSLLRARAEQGLGAVVALHDLNLAARFSDRILMLKQGVMEAVGTPQEVLTAATVERVFGLPVQVMTHPQGKYPLIVA